MLILLPTGACASRGETWESFKTRYMTAEGRIVDTGNGGVSHTEGQGWGMLLAEANNDRATFDRLWAWTETHLARKNVRLFRWRYDPAAPTAAGDVNNATDGDIFIAWALLRAHKRWKDERYAIASGEIRTAIAQRLVVQVAGRQVLAPGLDGFVSETRVIYNPSYFVLPALNDFARADKAGPWRQVIADGLQLSSEALFGGQTLPVDWMVIGVDGTLAPDPNRPPRFGFDAVRAPLYLVWGGARSNNQVERVDEFWRRFYEAGARPPAWIDVVTGQTAPYPLSLGGEATAAVVLGRNLTERDPAPEEASYYSSALELLAALAAKESKRAKPAA